MCRMGAHSPPLLKGQKWTLKVIAASVRRESADRVSGGKEEKSVKTSQCPGLQLSPIQSDSSDLIKGNPRVTSIINTSLIKESLEHDREFLQVVKVAGRYTCHLQLEWLQASNYVLLTWLMLCGCSCCHICCCCRASCCDWSDVDRMFTNGETQF